MPNWTYNKIVLRDDASFNAILECMRGKDDEGYENEFDFNRIVECPEIFRRCIDHQHEAENNADMAAAISRGAGIEGPVTFDDAAAWLKTRYPKLSIDNQKRTVGFFNMGIHKRGAIGIDEIVAITEAASDADLMAKADADNGELLIEARVLHGTTSWYNWRCAVWGVKWNADAVSVDKAERSISFTTPWSPVVDLMSKMCEKFRVEAYYCYDEEQTDVCYGQWWFDADGDIVDQDTPNEFDYDMFCIAVELTDQAQDYIRWDPSENRMRYLYDEDDDEAANEFFALPAVTDTTTLMRRAFLANQHQH